MHCVDKVGKETMSLSDVFRELFLSKQVPSENVEANGFYFRPAAALALLCNVSFSVKCDIYVFSRY